MMQARAGDFSASPRTLMRRGRVESSSLLDVNNKKVDIPESPQEESTVKVVVEEKMSKDLW